MGSERLVFERFVTTIDKYALVSDGDRILIALSGGADSIALLLLMLDLRRTFDIEIYAAHLNHLLRGRESDEDERFVQEFCTRFRVPCEIAQVDVRKKAREEKKNLEEAAREARLEFLNRTARKMRATKIALGHTMNDQAENVIHRMLRGAGTGGLSSMRPMQGMIIRPLLWIERERLESFLRSRDIPYRKDSSNEDLRFTRNRIRHSLIPLLERDYNPRIISALAQTADILAEENSFLDSIATEIFIREGTAKRGRAEIPSESLRGTPPALARRLLRAAIRMVKGDSKGMKYRGIERILVLVRQGTSGKTVLLPSGVRVRIEKNSVKVEHGILPGHIRKTIQESLNMEGRTLIDETGFCIDAATTDRRISRNELKASRKERAFLDLGKTGKELAIREARKGDSFHPFNAPGRKKVSDFFVDRKVPPSKRMDALVVTAKGEIAWLVGHEINDRFKVDGKTEKVLILEFKQL